MQRLLKISSFVLLMLMLGIAGCEGPQGQKGPQGPVGPAGEDGSVMYSGQGPLMLALVKMEIII